MQIRHHFIVMKDYGVPHTLNTLTSGLNQVVCTTTAKSGRELFSGSKDASLLVCTRKKIFGWEVQIFCEWRHK